MGANHKTVSSGVERHFSRRFHVQLVGEGALVGLVGGGVVTLYRIALSKAEELLRFVISFVAGNVLLILAWFFALVVLFVIVCKLMLWEPDTAGSGIPQTDAEVIGRLDMCWWRVLVAKFFEGAACALAGLSLGREGPSVQLAAISGKGVSRILKRKRGEERLLVTCGAAAGMSAAFHAPLTGTLFALEEIHKTFTAPLLISVMAASVVSDFICSSVLGIKPVLSLPVEGTLVYHHYAFVILLAVVTGVLGALHNLGMIETKHLFGKIKRGAPYTQLIVPFMLAGVVAFVWPDLLCGGDAIVDIIKEPESRAFSFLVVLLLAKYVYTCICFGSGAPGGTLFPLVVMGGLIGLVFGGLATLLTDIPVDSINFFIVLGICGLFSGVVRAPVTAVVLVFELTGSLDTLLSASLVSILAYVVANLMQVEPFYERLLAEHLDVTERSRAATGEKILETFHIGMGSYLEGRTIGEIPWPDGVKVVTVNRAGFELMAQGSTKLLALDDILVIVDDAFEEDARTKLNLMCRMSIEHDARVI